MTEPYATDLAYIHDAAFGDLARNAAPILLDALRRRRIAGGLVVDLGCGSGILAAPIAEAGYRIHGIDLSIAMIALARRRVPRGHFVLGSLREAELPPCAAVAAVGECINYLFDGDHAEEDLARLFQRIHHALLPGGLFLFDVAEPGLAAGPKPRRNYVETEAWAVLFSAEEDPEHQTLTRRITSFRKIGALYRRAHEIHRLRLFPRSDVTRRLRDAGFRVRVLKGYGPLPFPRGHAGFLARKA